MIYRQTENILRKLTARRQAILAAAFDVAAEQGLGAVQIIAVAERAGIAAGTVYRYFPSKAELIAALADAFSQEELQALREFDRRNGCPYGYEAKAANTGREAREGQAKPERPKHPGASRAWATG